MAIILKETIKFEKDKLPNLEPNAWLKETVISKY